MVTLIGIIRYLSTITDLIVHIIIELAAITIIFFMVLFIFKNYHYLTNRKLMEEQVVSYQQLLQEQIRLLEYNPDSLLICDLDGKIIFWNQETEKTYGFTKNEAIGKIEHGLLKTIFPIPLAEISDAFLKQGKWSGEILQTTKENKQIIVKSCWLLSKNLLGVPYAIIKTNKDLTQEKRILQELAELDQMKIVSQIAAGISHEIRNPMTTVRGYLQLLSLKNELASYQPKFKLMIEELDRANHIITEFLSLAKNKVVALTPQDLNQVISDLAPLLESDAISCGKQFSISLAKSRIPVLLDKSEIRQLMLNLVRNSLEAVGIDGKITIMTFFEQDKGVLAIKDNGNGIPNEVMDKLGTPFISTKESGTGLGLSICYRIANHHHGKIDIKTGNKGTTFYIRFPLWNGNST
jgi:signal transduction histidine kinase